MIAVVLARGIGQRMRAAQDGATLSETQRVAASAVADASTPDDVTAALEQEMDQFLKTGSKRKRSPIWRFAEIGVVLAALGAVGFALFTSSNVKPPSVENNQPAPAPANSLIKTNWSFETGDAATDTGGNRPPDGWEFVFAGQDSAYLIADGRTGGRSLEIQRGASEYSTTDVVYTDALPLGGGGGSTQAIKASTFVRRMGDASGSGAGLHVLFYGGTEGSEYIGGVLSSAIRGSDDWQEVVVTARAPASATHARIACCVSGEKARYAFDDVTAELVTAEGPQMKRMEIGAGKLRWVVSEAGLFDLVREDDGRTDILLRDGDITWTTRNRAWSGGLLSDMATTRSAEEVTGLDPAIRMAITVLEPFTKGSGSKLPEVTAMLTLSFVNGEPTIVVQISGDATPVAVGLIGRIRGANRLRPFSRFNGDELTFHRYADGLGTGRVPETATRVVMPRGEEFLQVASVGKPMVVRVEQDRQDALLDLFQSGSDLKLALSVNPDAEERATIRAEVEAARSEGRWGDSLDAILRLMKLSMFSRGAIADAASSVSTVVARLRYRITELEDALNNLKNGFTRDGFLRMQQQYKALLTAIGDKPIGKTHGPFLAANSRSIGETDPDLEYSRFFRDIARGIDTLESVETQFDSWIQQNRANVDAATLSRIEDDARKLLIRAWDFQNGGQRVMAIETYREVLRQYPLCRPATSARKQLVVLANELLEDATQQQRDGFAEMAAGSRNLARQIAKSAVANVWLDGESTGRDIWDPRTETWSAERTSEFVSNCFRVGMSNAAPVGWPDYAEKWFSWTEDAWRRNESDARRAARQITGE